MVNKKEDTMKILLIIPIVLSIAMSQYSHDTELKIGGMSYNLDNLYINWSNPQLDIPKGSFSIGHVKFGFANVQIVHRQDAYSEHSTFSFSGPNFLLNNLDINAVVKGYNPTRLLINNYNQSIGHGNPNMSNVPMQKGENDINFHLGGIELLFASKGSFDINNYNKLVDFQIDKARFRISNALISMMYNNMPASKLIIKMLDFNIELTDFSIELDNSQQIQRVKSLSGNVVLNNVEMNIPEEIIVQPSFKELSDLLGMYGNNFRIRQISMKLKQVNDGNYQLNSSFSAPFAMITLNGDYIMHGSGSQMPDGFFDYLSIEVRNLAPGLNELVKQWEIQNNQKIPRKGNAIFIELSGPPKDLKIKDLDINKLKN